MITHTMVLTQKGGVGKSVLSCLIYNAMTGLVDLQKAPEDVRNDEAVMDVMKVLSNIQRTARVVDVDVPAGKERSRSWLASCYPGAIPVQIQPLPKEIIIDSSKVMSHFDTLDDIMRMPSPCVLDFGANVVDSVLYWLGKSKIVLKRFARENIAINLVVPTVAADDSIQAAIETCTNMHGLCEHAGVNLSIYIVENARDGVFDVKFDKNMHYKKLLGLGDPPFDASFIKIPHAAQSEVWNYLPQHSLTPTNVFAMSDEDLAQKLGIDARVASRGRTELTAWFIQNVESFIEAGLIEVNSAKPTMAETAQSGPDSKSKARPHGPVNAVEVP